MSVLTTWPRLIAIPLLLVSCGMGSFLILTLLERCFMLSLSHAGHRHAVELARQRTRLIATFVAINSFFLFSDPSLGAFGGLLARAMRYGLLGLTAIWLALQWNRSSTLYRREATSASLRKQLHPFLPQLEEALDGRILDDLSADEVFILAKGLSAQVRYSSLTIYRNVLGDLFRSGRLDRAASFRQLEELRQVLTLREEDHYAAIRELSVLDPALLHLDARQRQARDVRESAASEAIADLLHAIVGTVPKLADVLPLYRRQLEKIRRQSGLDEDGWTSVLTAFLTEGGPVLPLIKRELDQLEQALADRLTALEASARQPLLRPLLVSLDLQMMSLLVALLPQLQICNDRDLNERFEHLRCWIPASVGRALRDRSGIDLPPVQAVNQNPPFPIPQLVDVLAGFWQDPDPETAAWAQWLLQRYSPARAEAVARQPRPGLPGSRLFQSFSANQTAPGGPLESQLLILLDELVDEACTPAALLRFVLPPRANRFLPGMSPFALLALPSR